MESMTKTYVGIDPGVTGAISILPPAEYGTIRTYSIPTIAGEWDRVSLKKFFSSLSYYNPVHIVVEDVKALQKPFDRGNWKLAECKSMIETFCVAYDIPYTRVHSKTWQKECWQGIPEKRGPSKSRKGKNGDWEVVKGPILTKEMSLIAAQRLFPGVDLRDPDRKTDKGIKAHDGVVDSLLIALYGKRKSL